MKDKHIGAISGVILTLLLVVNVLCSAWQEGASVGINDEAMMNNGAIGVNELVQVGENEVMLPVLMYHHLQKDSARWGDYVISPDTFENDLKYIKEHGYTAVTVREIQDFVVSSKALPEKPILITFDDGYESTYSYVFPILQKYNMPAVLSIIGRYTDLYSGDVEKNLSYSHANWDQLAQMEKSGLVEIGNHSYNMHTTDGRKGVRKKSDESDEQYHKVLVEDIGKLNEEIFSHLELKPSIFAYPFGALSKQTDGILTELGFSVVFTCEEKVNMLVAGGGSDGHLLRLNRFNRPHGIDIDAMFKKMGIA